MIGLIFALSTAAAPDCPARFTDVAPAARLVFTHDRGATPAHRMAETMGSGVAWLDYDGDGWIDLYAVQSGPFDPGGSAAQDRLFRNRGDGTFEDATGKAGLKDTAYGMGAFAADYDNDGDVDLYVTNRGGNILYRNEGNGTFADVTATAGVRASAWSTAAAWGDVDGDGRLDLYVARYVDDSKEKDLFCGDTVTGKRIYCPPTVFPGTTGVLYRNRGDGTFADVTRPAGIDRAVGKGLGAVFLDIEPDGKLDLYVANDEVMNFLFRNVGGGRFEDVSVVSGTGFDPRGDPQGGMGVDAGDLDGDGLTDLVVANYEDQTNEHYRNLGEGVFEDVSLASGFGPRHWSLVGFGLNLLDFDLDGDLDAFIANGHVDEVPKRQGAPYAQKPLLLSNDGAGRFRPTPCGPAFDTALVGRGSAAADYDNDGDPDLAVSNSGGPLQLLRNDGAHGRWLGVSLEGTRSNRQGIGARLVAELPSGRRLTRQVTAGSSYLGSSDPRVLFGLGSEASVRTLSVYWPSGKVQVVRDLPAGKYVTIEEK